MSDEVSIYNDPNAATQYLETLKQGGDQELAELREESNPFQVMPKLVLSKETKEIRAVHNDETLHTFSGREPLYFVAMLIGEHRALWRPEGIGSEEQQEDKFPVCSTARVPIGTFRRERDRGVGTWMVANNRDLLGPNGQWYDDDYEEGSWPENISVNCSTCPMNQFKSMREWDQNRGGEGRGKACGEGRLIVGYICRPVAEVEGGIRIFDFNPDSTMVFMNIPSTSIKAIKGMGNACVARQVPARYSVFNLGCAPQKSGQMKWGVLTQEHAGFVAPDLVKVCDEVSEGMRDLVFVSQTAPDIGESSQVSEDKEIVPLNDADDDVFADQF